MGIGDVHGDLASFERVLRLAGLLDAAGHWAGATTTAVQTGDILDRGDDEPQILELVARLEREALAAGGRFVTLNGNHELMNSQLDFRYVTADGFADYREFRPQLSERLRSALPDEMEGRAAAFIPGSALARAFASHPTVLKVGDTVFVHGGLDEEFAALGLDTVNNAYRRFFLDGSPLPSRYEREDSPVWNRDYAGAESPEVCAELSTALQRIQASRMVIGHTVQDGGITSACGGRVQRIDVGLAEYYGGPIEALEIRGQTTRVLHEDR